MRRLWLCLVAVLGLISACGSAETGGFQVADRVLERVGQPSGPQAELDTSDCVVREVVDEYGFKNEIVTCPPSFSPVVLPEVAEDAEPAEALEYLRAPGDLPPWVFDDLVDRVPEQSGDALGKIRSALSELDAACGVDIVAWRQALEALAAHAEELSGLVSFGRLDGWVGTTEARAFSRALMERSLLETACANPSGGAPIGLEALAADGTLELTSRASAALSELGRQISDASSAYLFHFFTPEKNYEWLRTQTNNVDLIVYGTSQAGAGIDIPRLSSSLSVRSGNASLAGSLAEVQQHWFVEVERYIDPETVLWLVGSIDLLLDCEPIGREQQFVERVERRARTFAATGWFEGLDPLNVVMGPAGPPNTNMGNGIKAVAPSQDAIDAHFIEYEKRFAAADFCGTRAATIASSAQRMVDDGRRVVVVGMPMNPIGYQQLSGGLGAAESAVGELASAHLAGTGAEVIDLTGVLQDRVDLWHDYTHLTSDGATAFTEILAAELRKLGL